MPETLPGFFVLAGLVLFVFSLFKGSLRVKDYEVPTLDKTDRITIRVLGVMLFGAGSFIYYDTESMRRFVDNRRI